ncbi:MAG: glycosyltransferase [Bacteroidaceae bacterium]|nr:glycosyltransferase [Bacteroidaceae bacterium]
MKKNLLFLVSGFLDGGIESVLVEVLRMLAEDERYNLTLAVGVKMEGLEVYHDRLPKNLRLVYLVDSPLLCAPKRKRHLKQSSPLEKIADEVFLNPFRRIIQKKCLHRLVEENDIVVDFDSCHTGFLSGCTKPKVAWMHFSLQKMMEQNRRRAVRITNRLRTYDRVVLICKAMAEEADRLFPELRGKCVAIYNALDVETLRKRAAEATAFPFPYILAVERLEESQKDIHTLLKAYSMLDTEEHLVIIGKGRDAEVLKDYARSLGLTVSEGESKESEESGEGGDKAHSAREVHFLGFKSNPQSWMAGARMLVHSAKFEGLPTVLIEGLLLGVPLVATDCPTGPSEILDNGKAGILVPVGDAEAMAEAISKNLTDAALRQRLLDHARAHCVNFTKASVKKQLDVMFAELPKSF